MAVHWPSSSWAWGSLTTREFLPRELRMRESLEGRMKVLHMAPQRKRITDGLRMMKTQGSMMELMERKRRATRSVLWLSCFWLMELMYTRTWM